MIGICEDCLSARVSHLLWRHCFNGRLGANNNKRRRLDIAVRCMYDARSRQATFKPRRNCKTEFIHRQILPRLFNTDYLLSSVIFVWHDYVTEWFNTLIVARLLTQIY